jgi:filamentous hemagglutinin
VPGADADDPIVLAARGRGRRPRSEFLEFFQRLFERYKSGPQAPQPSSEERETGPSDSRPAATPPTPPLDQPALQPRPEPQPPAQPQHPLDRPGSPPPPAPLAQRPLDRPSSAHPGFDTANLRDKLHKYLLDPEHEKNQGKAIWFKKALGFDQNNWQELAVQLYFDESKAHFQQTTPYGDMYSQMIPITGPNGRTIDTEFIFQKDKAGKVTLITGIPADK